MCRSLVPERKGSRLTEVRGIFPGATVRRGKDWPLGDEDGMLYILMLFKVMICMVRWPWRCRQSVSSEFFKGRKTSSKKLSV